MGFFSKVKDSVKEVVAALDEAMPPLPPQQPKPAPKKPGDARFARAVGERLGAAGLLAVTLAAAAVGAVACRVPVDASSTGPSCDEPAAWCGGAHR